MERQSPKINIFTTDDVAHFCKTLQLGMEEEGIESCLVSVDPTAETVELQEMCLEQCVSDSMGIAVAVGKEIQIYVKGITSKPLFSYDISFISLDQKKLFLIGKNAARFVKRKPFLEVEGHILQQALLKGTYGK